MPSFIDSWQTLYRWQLFGKATLPQVDLSGKTIVVTGANTGIGLECAKHLARANASVLILGCRSLEKGDAAKRSIIQETKCNGRTNIEVWQVDLCDFKSVTDFAGRIRSQLVSVDGFIANAGVEPTVFSRYEGMEQSLTVNVVSTMMLAIAVLPKLEETSKSKSSATNLTMVGSGYHCLGPDDQLEVPEDQNVFDALSDPETADMVWRYALSKLMLHLCCGELAQYLPRLNGAETSRAQVVFKWINPGWCKTELTRSKSEPFSERFWKQLLIWTAEQGGRTLVHAVTRGMESHCCYSSECQIKPQSQFLRSEKGKAIQKRVWRDLMAKIIPVSPDIASIVRE